MPILSIQIEILTIRKVFEAFERHSNANSKHSNKILSIRMQIRKGFEAFKWNLEPFKQNSKHSNANSNSSNKIRSIRMQILTIRKGFEAFECKFEQCKIKGFKAFECKFEPFERDSNHLNVNSNHFKVIRSIRMQIVTI